MKVTTIASLVLAFTSCTPFYKTMNAGTPWQTHIQQIPGRIECEYYNEGGEGIAYHDSDSINNGSGKLNPANGAFLNEFRMREGVDISYTKSHDIDNNPYSKVPPKMDQLYVGWTKPGEWIKYTVEDQAALPAIRDSSSIYDYSYDNSTKSLYTVDRKGKVQIYKGKTFVKELETQIVRSRTISRPRPISSSMAAPSTTSSIRP